MIEVRNDEIATDKQQAVWGDLLSRTAKAAFAELQATGAGDMPVRMKQHKG
jgi:predicted N-formylglutamate amidohydrolase